MQKILLEKSEGIFDVALDKKQGWYYNKRNIKNVFDGIPKL